MSSPIPRRQSHPAISFTARDEHGPSSRDLSSNSALPRTTSSPSHQLQTSQFCFPIWTYVLGTPLSPARLLCRCRALEAPTWSDTHVGFKQNVTDIGHRGFCQGRLNLSRGRAVLHISSALSTAPSLPPLPLTETSCRSSHRRKLTYPRINVLPSERLAFKVINHIMRVTISTPLYLPGIDGAGMEVPGPMVVGARSADLPPWILFTADHLANVPPRELPRGKHRLPASHQLQIPPCVTSS